MSDFSKKRFSKKIDFSLNLFITSSLPINSIIENKDGPIPFPVKISLKHGSKAPIPISFLSMKDLKVFSIVSALKDSIEFSSEKNSLTREIELLFHFFL